MTGGLPSLMVITDCERFGSSRTLSQLASLLVSAKPSQIVVQLRDRTLPARERWRLGRELRDLTRRHGQQLCVNDRIDLCLALGAEGLHLGEASVSAGEARRLVARSVWISRAWHDPTSIPVAHQGADALVLSPVFAPRKGLPALGTAALEKAHAAARAHGQALYALGGIDPVAARHCAARGIGVAAIGAVFEADARTLLEALGIVRSG